MQIPENDRIEFEMMRRRVIEGLIAAPLEAGIIAIIIPSEGMLEIHFSGIIEAYKVLGAAKLLELHAAQIVVRSSLMVPIEGAQTQGGKAN